MSLPDNWHASGYQGRSRNAEAESLRGIIFYGAIGSFIVVGFFAWLAFGVCR